MNVIELYKVHINPDATILEIHNFMNNFDIGKPYVPHPNEEIRIQIEKDMLAKRELAKQFILKNSKLKNMTYKIINWVVLIWSIIRLLIPDSREQDNNYYFLFHCSLFLLSFDRLVDIYFKNNKNEQNS